ncbi:ESX secretion-associated protein EspG [Antrihabitans cavernicola]|uniref:ESX secretion-associated protein EspG n=1 Tax=Antrihabitans cavernicola TaxID=2495913 RepID=A0A5A7SL76_9NOCA|nr:ESX secretion-associated protein EspG [Spelaeibacter cavernicola]KAA0024991.1 hypothetical protein FOY51_03505 [Spelaeibacter cavernicola]
MRWTFTPDEFMHVWAETDLDRYPHPLRLMSAYRLLSDFEVAKQEIAGRLRHGHDSDLSVALRIMAIAETRITITGEEGIPPQDIRMLGGSIGSMGVVVRQCPGPTGAVTIVLGPADEVPSRMVDALTSRPKGRLAPMTETFDRVRDSQAPVMASAAANKSAGMQIRRLLKSPRDCTGRVVVTRHANAGTPSPIEYISWMDIAGDGRYLIRQSSEIEVVPCSDDYLVTELARLSGMRERARHRRG